MAQRDKRGRLVCHCGGYPFPHRKGGGACTHSPTVNYYVAMRSEDPMAVALDMIAEGVWPFSSEASKCLF